MKLSDLITRDVEADAEMAYSDETDARHVLEQMSECGSEHIRVNNAVDKGTTILSQRHIIRGILDEVENAQSQLEYVYGQLSEDLLGRFGISDDKRCHEMPDNTKLAHAVNKMSEGLIILDSQLRVETVNPSAKRLLGVQENATNETVSAVLDVIGIRSMIVNNQDKNKAENVTKVKVDDKRMLRIRWAEISGANNDSDYVIMLNDATNEITAEKVKTDFIAAISHELRTPVTSIQNSVSNILAGVTGRINKRTREYLEIMNDDCHRFTDLISDLLDTAKLQAGSLPVNRRVIDIITTINEAINNFQKKANDKGLILKFINSGSVSPVFADSQRIFQVLWNLITNAIDYTEPGGKITVGAYDQDDQVVVFIEDTGIGIRAERQRKIFDKFYQVNRQAGAGYKGTGLGLAICQGIILMHGGRIWVESERSKGSKFMFSIPKCDPAAALREHAGMLSEHCRRKDDDFAFIMLNFDFPNGEDQQKKENAALVINEIITKSVDFLTNKEDLVLKINDSTISMILRGHLNSRMPRIKEELKKIINNTLKNNFNTGEILPMFGTAIYPSDTRQVTDLEEIARASLKELTC